MAEDITPPVTTPPADPPRLSRPRQAAAAIKDWVVERGMMPGDRLPGEPELIAHFGMAKGTIREALRVLEAQGLIRTRTGPGGGAFVNEVTEVRARARSQEHTSELQSLRRISYGVFCLQKKKRKITKTFATVDRNQYSAWIHEHTK